MIQFSNIVKKWREDDFSEQKKEDKKDLQFNAGAQKILKQVSENSNNERENSQKKFSGVIEQLEKVENENNKEVVKKTFSRPTTQKTKGKFSHREKISHREKTSHREKITRREETPQEPKKEIVEKKNITTTLNKTPEYKAPTENISKNIDWEEDDFTEGLFHKENSSEKSSSRGLFAKEMTLDNSDHLDQTDDSDDSDDFSIDETSDNDISEYIETSDSGDSKTNNHRTKNSYQRKHRNHRNPRSKYKNNRSKDHGHGNSDNDNGNKKEKKPYHRQKEETDSAEHLNIESVLKSMKSTSHEEQSNHDQGSERRNFSPRKNDKRNRHKWV